MEDASRLSPVAQDYLKVVWTAREWSDDAVTVKLLADRIGVGPSTVSETVRRLAAQGLVEHAKYGAITLTEEGARQAVRMVRRHRIVETYLFSELGYAWDEVHDEAEVLEHAVSDGLIARMDAKLGHPKRDPHGDPIPGADGTFVAPAAVPLSACDPGASGRVVRIWDADRDILRYLDELEIGPDASIRVVGRREYAGTMTVSRTTAEGRADQFELGLAAAEHVWIGAGPESGPPEGR